MSVEFVLSHCADVRILLVAEGRCGNLDEGFGLLLSQLTVAVKLLPILILLTYSLVLPVEMQWGASSVVEPQL